MGMRMRVAGGLSAYDRARGLLALVASSGMDRKLLEQRLAEAERNVALGFELIAEQRQIAAAPEAWGQDPTVARRMLQMFEAMQTRYFDDWDAAIIQLAADDQRG